MDYKIRIVSSNISIDRFYNNIDPVLAIEELIEISSPKKNEKIIAPIFESRRGHPVLFDISMKNEIMLISGDVGAKEILKKNKDNFFY